MIITPKIEGMLAKRLTDLHNQTMQRSQYMRLLLIGDGGVGKTDLCCSAPKPIHIDSFDPDGTALERRKGLFESGDILTNTNYEYALYKDGTAVSDWARNFDELKGMDYFSRIGTYVLDSLSNFGEAVMSMVVNDNPQISRVGKSKSPAMSDHFIQQPLVVDFMKMICQLPCHTIVTAHIGRQTNDATGEVIISLAGSQQFALKVQQAFAERWFLRAMVQGDSVSRWIQTQTDGYYHAKSVRGGGGRLPGQITNLSLQQIFKDLDLAWQDKEKLFKTEGE